MDPIEIEGPDGVINEFPAGTSDADIQTAMRAQYGGPENDPETPKQGSMLDDFVRGVDRIAGTTFSGQKQRPVSLEEYGQEAENIIRSGTAPLGGDYIAAAGSAVAGKGFNPAEQRARREALADRNAGSKTAAIASEVLGAGAVGKILAPAGGGIVKQGAATGAITGANVSGGDIVETAKGAAGGAIGGKVVEKIGEGLSGLAALAGRLKTADGKPVNVNLLAQQFKDLEAALGRKPTIVELADVATKPLQSVAEGRRGAMKAFEAAQDADALARPARMATEVRAGNDITGSAEMLAQRDDVFTKAMDPIRKKAGAVAAREAEILLHPDVIRSLDDAAREGLERAITNKTAAMLTLEQVDTVRRTLGNAVKSAQKDGANLQALQRARATARLIGERISPKYKTALAEYEGRSDMARGAAKGEKIRSASPGDMAADSARMGLWEGGGQTTGARKAITEAAGASNTSALRTARELTEPGMRQKTATSFGQSEADRLAAVGGAEQRGAENLAEITKKGLGDVVDETDVKKMASFAAMAAAKTKSPGLLVQGGEAIIRAVKGLGMAPGVGKKLAELATSPDGAEKVIAFLHRAKVGQTAIAKIARTLGIPYGAVSATGD